MNSDRPACSSSLSEFPSESPSAGVAPDPKPGDRSPAKQRELGSRGADRDDPLPDAADPHAQQQAELDAQSEAAAIPVDLNDPRRPPGEVAGGRTRTDAPEPKPGLDPSLKDTQVG